MKYIKWAEPGIGDEEIAAVTAAIETGWVGSNGPLVKQFEREFARRVGAKYAIAVNNGTSALTAALLTFQYRLNFPLYTGVPTFTFIASANTAWGNGDIKLIDCDKDTWNIKSGGFDSQDINLLMTVDVGGLPCDYDSLKELEIPIVADSAESLGAWYKGEPIGTQADVHCFSFHTAKIITTGEGGMITTNNEELYELMHPIVNHGYAKDKERWEYKHAMRGFNFRMTELEAAIGIVQLKKLDRYVRERRKKAQIYRDILSNLVEYQLAPPGCCSSYFFFGILIDGDTGIFCDRMYTCGVEVKTWTAVHRQPAYQHLRGSWPNADSISDRVVLLPIHNKLNDNDVEHIAKIARRILKWEN